MTKAAFAHWESRIAPVFDVARRLLVIADTDGQTAGETQEFLPQDQPVHRALRLAELGVGVLVCGAISRPLQELVQAQGIQVIPFVAGELREVVQAWRDGRLESRQFAMPGCCGRGRWQQRFRGRAGCRATGPTGFCLCPACGRRVPHQRGFPCVERTCPTCGASMVREVNSNV